MKRQNEVIFRSTESGHKVKVYALEVPSQLAVVNGLEIENYLAQDYEKALIKLHAPELNGRPRPSLVVSKGNGVADGIRRSL